MTLSKKFRALAVTAPLAISALTLTSTADAYVLKHTSSGATVRWNAATLDFAVSPTVASAASGARDAVSRAMAGWSKLTPDMPTLATHDGAASDKPGYDGKSIVYYAQDGFAPAGKALAVTVLSFDSTSGDMLDADIVLNGNHDFAVLADGARSPSGVRPVATESGGDDRSDDSAFDLVHVFAHETGHALGLGDEGSNSSALMYPYTFPGDARMRAPMSDDAAGMASIYVTAPTGGSSSSAQSGAKAGCSSSGRSPSGAWSWSFGALALVLPALSRRARKRTRRALLMATPFVAAAGAVLPTRKAKASIPPARMQADATRFRVLAADARWNDGIIQTRLSLTRLGCGVDCPETGTATVWGGTLDGITQVVGEPAPRVGDEVVAQ